MKTCTICNTTKPIDQYYAAKSEGKYRSSCKQCAYDKAKKWNTDNVEKRAIIARRNQAKQFYGVSLEEFDKCMATSESCVICGSKERLCYDHDHITNLFRGVLCGKCNTGIGMLGDSKEGLSRALKYLQEHEDANI